MTKLNIIEASVAREKRWEVLLPEKRNDGFIEHAESTNIDANLFEANAPTFQQRRLVLGNVLSQECSRAQGT